VSAVSSVSGRALMRSWKRAAWWSGASGWIERRKGTVFDPTPPWAGIVPKAASAIITSTKGSSPRSSPVIATLSRWPMFLPQGVDNQVGRVVEAQHHGGRRGEIGPGADLPFGIEMGDSRVVEEGVEGVEGEGHCEVGLGHALQAEAGADNHGRGTGGAAEGIRVLGLEGPAIVGIGKAAGGDDARSPGVDIHARAIVRESLVHAFHRQARGD